MSHDFIIPQAAAIPFRVSDASKLEILLIRRRCGGGWGVPKGNVDPGFTPEQTAETEAIEEAGIQGELLAEVVGEFSYAKEGGQRLAKVFALRVTKTHERWLEMSYRERVWFPADQAAELVMRPGLKQLVADFVRTFDPLKFK